MENRSADFASFIAPGQFLPDRDEAAMKPVTRILLVDDEVTFLKTLKRHLRRKGFSLETAENGKKASMLIQEKAQEGKPFDLVISDMVMPNMGGLELLGWVQKRFPETSVILLTAFGEKDAVSNAIRPEFDGFGSKPITPEKMLTLIRNVSDNRRRTRSPAQKPEAAGSAGRFDEDEPANKKTRAKKR